MLIFEPGLDKYCRVVSILNSGRYVGRYNNILGIMQSYFGSTQLLWNFLFCIVETTYDI